MCKKCWDAQTAFLYGIINGLLEEIPPYKAERMKRNIHQMVKMGLIPDTKQAPKPIEYNDEEDYES